MKPDEQESETESDIAVNRTSIWIGLALLALLVIGAFFLLRSSQIDVAQGPGRDAATPVPSVNSPKEVR